MTKRLVENRRNFLKVSGLGAALVASQGALFGKNRVISVENGKENYPNTNYTEEMYRSEFHYTYGKKEEHGFAYHCVNCQGNCAWEIWSHNGVVTRENQSARYPVINAKIPDFNPRGCNKGVLHSQVMYEKDRILYPMKRVGERGAGKWKRVTWDEAGQEVAEKLWDVATDPKRGLDKLMVHAGTGLLTEGRRGGPLRFSTQIGAVRIYPSSYLGDMFTGASVAYGEGNLGCTYDFQYTVDTAIMWGANPDNTRIPDAHFIWEGKYNGAKVIVITPEFNASARHADLWVPIKSGTDNILAMAVINDIIKNKKYMTGSIKTYTDLPFLVREDNKKLIRRTDIEGHGDHLWEEEFYFMNNVDGKIARAPGTEGNKDNKSLRLKDHGINIDPALEGRWEITVKEHGHEKKVWVTTAFELLKAEAAKFDPANYKAIDVRPDSKGKTDFQKVTGVHPNIVTILADEFSKAENNKVTVTTGFALNKIHNGVLNVWNIASICGLTGRYGPRGGINTENEFSLSGLGVLAGFGGKYKPRFGSGFLGEYMMGDMDTEFDKYFSDKDIERAYNGIVKDKKEFTEILDTMRAGEAERKDKDGMIVKPYWLPDTAIIVADAKFRRNKAAYNAKFLERTKWLCYVDYRMSATAAMSDLLLPAKSHYEVWDLRASPGYHRFANLANPVANMKAIGEAKDEWTMFAFLAKKLQEHSTHPDRIDQAQIKDDSGLARDGVRRFDIFFDEYTNIDEESEEELEPVLGIEEDNDKTGDRLALEAALEATDQFKPHTIEKMYKQGGFLQLNEKAGKNSPLYADRPYNSLENHVFRFERFETVSGRQTFYVDHDLWIKLGANTNTGRQGIKPVDEKFKFSLMTPHARWSIHSNYKTAKLLQRLQRGKPWIMVNPKVAEGIGVKDGEDVKVYNKLGEFYAMAKVTSAAPLDTLVMEDGWDPNFFREKKHNNVVVPPSLSLLEMADGWGHLKFGGVWDGNQYVYDGAVDVVKA
jgi:complex iron-sulfur molybdoenzyme family reductase subunit alpha